MCSSPTTGPVDLLLEAIKAHPEILGFQTAWELTRLGVRLDCSMDDATMALRIAQERSRTGRIISGRVVYHTGCIGDLIAALPIIRHLGGASLKIGNFQVKEWQHRNMEGASYRAIEPLLKLQPYLDSVSFEDGAAHTHDLDNWRTHHRLNRTLTASQAAHLKITEPISMDPWLSGVTPSKESSGKLVVARSQRYHNNSFPWKMICRNHGPDMLFIGTEAEHSEFTAATNYYVPHWKTKDLLEAAELILGSAMFIGNQSSPCWVAMGLGHRLVQETHPSIHDSIVERENAIFHYSMRPRNQMRVMQLIGESLR